MQREIEDVGNEEDGDMDQEEIIDSDDMDSDYDPYEPVGDGITDTTVRKYQSTHAGRKERYRQLYETPKMDSEAGKHSTVWGPKITGRRVGQYGVLPNKAWQQIQRPSKAVDTDKIGLNRRGLLRTVWGGAMAPFAEKPANLAKEAIDDQYAKVVGAIEKQLGSRTNSNLWQGRLMAQKAIWDLWIDYVKNVLLTGLKEGQTKWTWKKEIIDNSDKKTSLLLLVNNLVDMQIYLSGNMNLNDDEKIALHINLVLAEEPKDEANAKTIISEIEQAHPNYIGKLSSFKQTDNTYKIYLKLRVYLKNTSELKWRPTAKYGPFDVLYTKVGTFKKTYIDATLLPAADTWGGIAKGQDNQYYDKVADEMAIQMAENPHPNGFYFGTKTFKFGKYCLIGDTRLIQGLTGLIQNASFTAQKSNADYYMFLKLNFTLAKWFYGKKSALQKINQERVQNYLRKDATDLKKVMHFFGGNADFIDRRR